MLTCSYLDASFLAHYIFCSQVIFKSHDQHMLFQGFHLCCVIPPSELTCPEELEGIQDVSPHHVETVRKWIQTGVAPPPARSIAQVSCHFPLPLRMNQNPRLHPRDVERRRTRGLFVISDRRGHSTSMHVQRVHRFPRKLRRFLNDVHHSLLVLHYFPRNTCRVRKAIYACIYAEPTVHEAGISSNLLRRLRHRSRATFSRGICRASPVSCPGGMICLQGNSFPSS